MTLIGKAGSGSVRHEDFNDVVDALGGKKPPTVEALTFEQQSGPDTPPPGSDTVFFDLADGLFKYVDDQGVVTTVGSGGGGNVPFVGDDPPASPTDGMLWWDPDDSTDATSPTIEIVRFQFTPATTDIFTTGAVVYTPTAGDVYLCANASLIRATVAWDGTTPTAHVFAQGEDPGDGVSIIENPIDALPFFWDGPSNHLYNLSIASSGVFAAADTTPLVVLVDDGAGGASGSTTGAAEVVLLVLKADA